MKKRQKSFKFLKRTAALLLAVCCMFTAMPTMETKAASVNGQETSFLLLDTIVGRYKLNYTGNTNHYAYWNNITGRPVTNSIYNDVSGWSNSSTATLSKSSGATGIKYAFLVWETRAPEGATTPIILRMPTGKYRSVAPTYAVNDWRVVGRAGMKSMYCMAADVTSIVKNTGYGNYTVCNIPRWQWGKNGDINGGEAPGSWQLIVVEEGQDFPVRAVSLKVGAEFKLEKDYISQLIFANGISSKSTGTATGQIFFGASNESSVSGEIAMTENISTYNSGGGLIANAVSNTITRAGLYRNGNLVNDRDYSAGCICMDLSDINSNIGNNAKTIKSYIQNTGWTTFFLLGTAIDIAFPDFSSNQTTTVNSSTSITVSGKITNTSPQEYTGIYDGNLTVDLDSGLVTDASRCSVTVNGVPAAALTRISYVDGHYQVQFYGGSIVNFMRGNTIEYSIECSPSGSGKTRFDNSDSFNGYLRSDGVNTGYWIDKAWKASSYALAVFHVTVNAAPLAYGNPFSSLSGAGDYLFGSYPNVSATLNPGYSFAGWTGTYTSAQNPYMFKMPANDVTLYANATDDPPAVTISGQAGEWSATADVSDVTSPWLRENVALTVNASDLGSGLAKVSVASDGTTVKSVAYAGEQTGDAGYTVQKEGTTTYYGIAADRNGATGTSKKLTVKIDKTAPGGTARVKKWTEDNYETTIKADINDTKDGTTTDVSKVKRVYVEIWNEDDPSDKKTYEMSRTEGDNLSGIYSVTADLFQEFPTAGYLKCTVYAEDNSGNSGEIPCVMPTGGHIQNFFITAYITRDDPNTSGWMGAWCTDPSTGVKDVQDNDFLSGQYGTMHIYTYGYVESVDVDFPEAFAQAAAKDISFGIETVPAGGVNIITDPAINPKVVVTEGGCGRSVEYNFKVPLYMHEWLDHFDSPEGTKYVRTWFETTATGHKGSATCETYPALRVGGDMCVSITETFRTRLRDKWST